MLRRTATKSKMIRLLLLPSPVFEESNFYRKCEGSVQKKPITNNVRYSQDPREVPSGIATGARLPHPRRELAGHERSSFCITYVCSRSLLIGLSVATYCTNAN